MVENVGWRWTVWLEAIQVSYCSYAWAQSKTDTMIGRVHCDCISDIPP